MVTNPIPISSELNRLWIGLCTVSEYQQVIDPVTHQTTSQPVIIVENEPCRLSYSTVQITNVMDSVPVGTQIIKLFIRPDLKIKAGSKLTITQHGITNTFKRASEPAIYTNHQEVVLELDKTI